MAIIDYSSSAFHAAESRTIAATALIDAGLQRYLEVFDWIQHLPGVRFARFDRKMDIVGFALAEIEDPVRMSDALRELRRSKEGADLPEADLRALAIRRIAEAHAAAFTLLNRIEAERRALGLSLPEETHGRIRGQISLDYLSNDESGEASRDRVYRLFLGAPPRESERSAADGCWTDEPRIDLAA